MSNKKLVKNIWKCKGCGQVLEAKTPTSYAMCPCGNYVFGKKHGGPKVGQMEDRCVYEEKEG